jgi:hypothetical protein
MRALYLLTFLMVAGIANAQVDPPEGWEEDPWADDETDTLRWNGFIEGALGNRWQRDPQLAETNTLGDLRLRLETERAGDVLTVGFKGDLWYDGFLGEFDGELRDLTLAFSPTSNWDVKIGRQVLTWGTGDLVFLNDLFPKDWVSFFAGRQDEYLKAPSNTIRATRYADAVNVDLAWTPIFEPDEYLTGERFSFFSPVTGQRVAPSPPLNPVEPTEQFENGELALRLFKNIGGVEYAAYAYHGYFHQPTALTDELQPTFAPLMAIGASLRRPLRGGLFNTEVAYYASPDDRSGDDPLVPNDQVRLLLGYEREAVTNFTVAFQYYLEWTQDHDALVANSPTSQFEPDEYRHVLTNRLTYRTDQDKLTLSLFTFYSPSDRDYYLRPQLSYRYSDKWTLTCGANVFGGQDAHTFFEQFADNSNLYIRVRYNY